MSTFKIHRTSDADPKQMARARKQLASLVKQSDGWTYMGEQEEQGKVWEVWERHAD